MTVATVAALALALLAGCAGEWDDKVAFPGSYASTYTKMTSCMPSQHPAAKYVETWVSPDGKATWDAFVALPAGSTETVSFPTGAVLLKAQYDDAKCKELNSYTVMEKLEVGAAAAAGDWRWQHVDADGGCLNCDNGTGCSGCHTQKACNNFFCTKP